MTLAATPQTASLSPILKQATPVIVDHALGSWIHGTDGNSYLDFTTGIGVTSTGPVSYTHLTLPTKRIV